MSSTSVTIEKVEKVEDHPNADKLDLIQILGYRLATGKGNVKEGDTVYYFPPDILLPPDVAKKLEVAPYLKHAIFPGDAEKSQCRVGAARLRGVPSHGFCAPITNPEHKKCGTGVDVSHFFGAKKYEPPERGGAGDSLPEIESFHRYTEIENIQRYPGAFEKGEEVIITEKIHGTNCRLGFVKDPETSQFITCAGSNRLRRTLDGLYGRFLDEDMATKLKQLSRLNTKEVVMFGEIFGPGVQDMKYGMLKPVFRVFDITINGEYMWYDELTFTCTQLCLPMVPLLYRGPYSEEVVEEHTYGKTSYPTQDTFKGREGCVIRPVREEYSPTMMGRKILKSISADYRDRRGATDDE